MAVGKNLTIEQGTTFRRKIILRDSTGALLNHSAYTWVMKVRQATNDEGGGNLIFQATSSASTSDPHFEVAAGHVFLVIPFAKTALMNFERGVYAISYEGGGIRRRVFQGYVSLDKDPNR